MRLLDAALAAAAVLAATPAAGQFSNHGIAVESGISTPLGAAGAPGAAFAVSASSWLEDDLEAVARVAFASAAGTVGRAAASATLGTLGLRLSIGHPPVRPQVFVDVGWARVDAGGAGSDRSAFGSGAALEWFPTSDFSVSPRAAFRVIGGGRSVELTLSLAGYF